MKKLIATAIIALSATTSQAGMKHISGEEAIHCIAVFVTGHKNYGELPLKSYGVNARQLIRDLNSKVNATYTKARQDELGFDYGVSTSKYSKRKATKVAQNCIDLYVK